VRWLSSVRDTGAAFWRALDAPWLSKLGGLGTLIWIVPILFGAFRALTGLDALTVAVLAVGVTGLGMQALRHRGQLASQPKPGSIQVGKPRSRVVRRAPVITEADQRALEQAMNEGLKDFAQTMAEMEAATPKVSPRRPALSFGRPQIPEHPQPIFLTAPSGERHRIANGRVIQVPVMNAQGAAEAKNVHARLRFVNERGKTEDRMYTPQETEAEWFGRHGPEDEINLPATAG
jgi:hypothetical protein